MENMDRFGVSVKTLMDGVQYTPRALELIIEYLGLITLEKGARENLDEFIGQFPPKLRTPGMQVFFDLLLQLGEAYEADLKAGKIKKMENIFEEDVK